MESFAPFLEKLFDNLAEIILFLVIAIFTACLGRVKNWWKDRAIKRFEKGINQNVRLRELLSELRVPYAADRVMLYQFHNGDYYHSGESIMKCSLTHFVTKIGVSNPPYSQNIPTTQMIMSLKSLQDKPIVEFRPDSFEDDSLQDSLFAVTGASLCVNAAVRNTRGNWIGILCVCWTKDPEMKEPTQLLTYAKLVGQFLSKQR